MEEDEEGDNEEDEEADAESEEGEENADNAIQNSLRIRQRADKRDSDLKSKDTPCTRPSEIKSDPLRNCKYGWIRCGQQAN